MTAPLASAALLPRPRGGADAARHATRGGGGSRHGAPAFAHGRFRVFRVLPEFGFGFGVSGLVCGLRGGVVCRYGGVVSVTPVLASWVAWLAAWPVVGWLRPSVAAGVPSGPVPAELAVSVPAEAAVSAAARRAVRLRRLRHLAVVRAGHRRVRLAWLRRTRAARAVRVALGEVGVWYRWGGASPAGFDCSGLTWWAYRRVGVRLPRTTFGQIRVGRAVRGVAGVLPGDLLFPSSGHVLLAVGGGRVVEAAHSGTRVRVRPISGWFVAIRRPV